MGGCWGWRGRIGRTRNVNGISVERTGPLPDLEYCSGRTVIVLLDANVNNNPKVQYAERALVAALRNYRCSVKVCRLPQPGDASDEAWNGPDDFLSVAGDEAFTAVIDTPIDTRGRAGDFSDVSLAVEFADRYGDDVRYVEAWGRWLLWNGSYWSEDETSRALYFARVICSEAGARCGHVGLGRTLQSVRTIAAVEKIARTDPRLIATVNDWNADPMLFGCANGTLDLRIGELRSALREDFITKASAYNPSGDCPLWLSFLNRIFAGDDELIRYIQKVCGYALSGSTVEHQLWFFYGSGANGKSVLLNTLYRIFGSYARVAAIETFLASRNGTQHPADLAFLCGSRLVVSTEVDKGRHWSEAKLKGIVAGDTITCRYMHCNFFSYTPNYKVLIAGNTKPELRTVDEAARRRMRLIPFDITIPEAERDPRLAEKLLAEANGILKWCADGCLLYLAEGLTPPKAVTDTTAAYLASEDAIARWMEERTEKDPQKETLSSRLFQDWTQWSEFNGEHTGKHKSFAQSLSQHGCVSRHTEFGTAWIGLKLKTLPDENDVKGYWQ